MKETLVKENDRNTASPTESAVCGSLQREHSGADCPKPSGKGNTLHALSVKRG